MIKRCNNEVTLTANMWSYRIFKGYISVTAHAVDDGWAIHSGLPELNRFLTRHTGESLAALLYDVVRHWNFTQFCRYSSIIWKWLKGITARDWRDSNLKMGSLNLDLILMII